ncbi:hypothetical protein WA026_009924 [Henosepilachna vigintioctopunctata]|uniref:Uncharacterized protein n=1 Tax=Henosepilachna vigintioctopunctata TaxID=420089 RepID=A0AAW1TSB8_9CUCU
MEVLEESVSLGYDDIIPATPDEKMVKILKKAALKRQKNSKWQCNAEFISLAPSETFMKLKNSGCPLKGQMYVFCNFNTILKYKPKSKPLNSYIKIIGYYKISRSSIPYIQGYEMNDQKFAIFVDLETVDLTPQINDVVEVFGHLEFRRVVNHDLPIIIVHFWSKLNNSISSYIHCLKMQRMFFTNNALEVEDEPEENDSLVELLQDISFGIISIVEK